MHLFRSSICWTDRKRRRLPVLSPPLPGIVERAKWANSRENCRARREVGRRERRKNFLLSLLSLMPVSGNIHARSCISCALLSLSSYFVFSLRDTITKLLYQNENFSRNENRNDWLVREPNFASISCEQMQRNVWRWNELVPEWNSFRYHVNSSKGMLRYGARILLFPQFLFPG